MKTILLLLSLTPLGALAQSQAEIVGKVQAFDNRGMAYTTVSLSYGNYVLKTVLADADGVFIFDNLQPGVYSIAATSGNSNSKKRVLWISSGVSYMSLVIPHARSGMYTSPTNVSVREIEYYLDKPKPKPGLIF